MDDAGDARPLPTRIRDAPTLSPSSRPHGGLAYMRYAAGPGRSIVFAVVAAVVAAGCLGDSRGRRSFADADGTLPATAPEPTLTGDTGAIRGLVVDDEARAIPGARILLDPSGSETRTAEDGSFVFDGLPAAAYQVTALAAGYESDSQRTAVPSGQVVQLDFVLAAIPAKWPRVDQHVGTAYLECGLGLVASFNCSVGPSNTRPNVYFDVEPGLTTLLVEAQWEERATVGSRDGRNWLRFQVTDPAGGTRTNTFDDPPTAAYRFEFNETDSNHTEGRWRVNVYWANGYLSEQYQHNTGLLQDQRIDVYVTRAYYGYHLDAAYSGLPPE